MESGIIVVATLHRHQYEDICEQVVVKQCDDSKRPGRALLRFILGDNSLAYGSRWFSMY